MESRRRMELMLQGRWVDAGARPLSLAPADIETLAAACRDLCGSWPFPDPHELAARLAVHVCAVPDLPEPGYLVDTEARLLTVCDDGDPLELGLLILRGLSKLVLAEEAGVHTEADAVWLAAELAAPSDVIIRRGLEEAVRRQRHVPAWFIRAWGDGLAPPSSDAARGL